MKSKPYNVFFIFYADGRLKFYAHVKIQVMDMEGSFNDSISS
jgi:hypothetical protein